MKLTSSLFAAFVALSIASAQGQQQVPPINESLAYARLVAAIAHKAIG